MNFKDLQISFDALLIAAIEDTSNERLTQFADFFKKTGVMWKIKTEIMKMFN